MRIIEPKKMVCKNCNKELKDESEGFGIPVFKGFYFKREWMCKNCLIVKVFNILKDGTKK